MNVSSEAAILTFKDIILGEFLERDAEFDTRSGQFWRMSQAKRRVHTPKREKCRTVEKRDPPQGGYPLRAKQEVIIERFRSLRVYRI